LALRSDAFLYNVLVQIRNFVIEPPHFMSFASLEAESLRIRSEQRP
jgi:hypothetical protein